MRTIERARQVEKLSRERLANEAGISRQWYETALREPERASEAVLQRLAGALRRLREAERRDEAMQAELVKSTFGGFLACACRAMALDVAQVRALDPSTQGRGRHGSRLERQGARARQVAIYLTNVSLGVQQRVLARAVGITPAAVCLLLKTIEDLRDDPDFDRLVEACAREVTGEAA